MSDQWRMKSRVPLAACPSGQCLEAGQTSRHWQGWIGAAAGAAELHVPLSHWERAGERASGLAGWTASIQATYAESATTLSLALSRGERGPEQEPEQRSCTSPSPGATGDRMGNLRESAPVADKRRAHRHIHNR